MRGIPVEPSCLGQQWQQAVFDNGKTLVISETTQGRLDSLTLIRVGRVAMLWNHARHVIVYERTTRTAPRYTHGEQPDDFEGLAALRKVREYVEILQPRRDYPDFPAGLPYAGPLQRSTFETTVIPVKSTWGRDVENGWVMPLRGPLSPEEEEAFPVPKVFSELARAAGKGEGRIAHRVTNPDVLHFFTSTRDEDGGDTDAWPSFPDVDFPVTERPSQPPLPSAPRFSDLSIQPDAVGVGYGQRRFTVDLAPAEEAANLMHGRPVPGIEARVHNLSLARGKPPVLAPCDSLEALAGRPFAEAEAVLRDGIAELSGSLARLDRGGDATLGQIGQSWSEAQALHKNLANRATALRGTLEKQRSDLEKYAFSWRKEQDLWLERHGASAKRLVERELKPAVETALQTAGDLVGKGQDALKQSLTIDLEGLCRQARGHLDEVSLLPELALEPLRRASRDLRARTEATLAGARVRIDALLSDLEARYAAEGARALEAELFEGLFDVRERLVAFQSQARRLGSEALGVWFGLQRDAAGKPNAVDQIADAVNIACGNVLRELELAIGEIPPLEVGVDWASIRALFGSLEVDVAPLFDKIDAHISKLANVDIEIGGKRYGLLPKDGRSRWKELLDPGASIEKACGAAHDIIEKLKFENVASDLATAHGVLQSFVEKAGEKLATSSPELGAFLDAFGKIESWNSTLGETGDINQPLDAIESALEELGSVLASAGSPVADAAAAAGRAATLLGEHLDALGRRVEGAVLAEARALGRLLPSDGIHLELTRALAEGPVTDALRCTRRLLGYTYDAASALLQATRSSALFNDLGPGVLNSLGVRLPFDRLGDRLLPRLDGLAIGDLFPDFGGLKLAHFLKGLRVPSDPAQEFGWVRVTHGFDKDRLLGWAEVVVDKRFEEEPSLFDLPPFSLRLVRPHFSATSRFEADATGGRHQTSRASLAADWKLCLSNQPVITIKKGVLRHESDGGFGFDFKAKDLELAEPLRFVTDAVSALLPQAEGLTVSPVPPGGISAELNLPLPDLAAGAFTLTGITLHSHFDLLIGQGFEVRAGLWLSKPDRPFGLAVLFLGGGGWFGVDVSYRPPDVFETRLSVGISAGAFVSLNFGVAKGSAGVLFTAGLDFYRSDRTGARGDTSVSLGLLVWGEFSIVGIASAHLRMVLRVTYRNGEMKGHGRMSVRIKICWCFTLEVESEIDLPFDRGGAPRAMPAGTKALSAPRLGTAASVTPVATIERAVDLHLGSLDLVEAA
ncbi:MAG TPA: hypothetical protein PLP50_02150 [Thermoanaerobaculia bacterium]|nr:hypothetical protein [Thermoanaerobaculia bacterium]HQP87883.1 hypothetical protein [Thermoanaerobaculia bacterium]